MQTSIACLQADELNSFIAGELPDQRYTEVESHLSTCEMCRAALDNTVGDPDWWNDLERALGTAQTAAASGEDSDIESDVEQRETDHRRLIELLGPTDDPSMMGRIGSYEIVGILGQGGMGAVFKAFDAALNRYVAIKVLLPHLASSGAARARFRREGQAAAAVIDDHVLPIYAVDQWQGTPYLVMQYTRGVSLQKRLQNQGPLELREILRVGLHAARGLAAAHAQGLVHRDVKPSNILLDTTVERSMLTDFGLARAVDDATLTRSDVLAGTPQYMSPEQARAETVDHRSDLFSLGSVLYAMCTGHAPFRSENSIAVLRLISDKEPRLIREVNPDVPDWLCAIIAKLMSKQAEDRYESSAEVAEMLEDCLAHVQQPTTTPLPAPVAKLAKSFGSPSQTSERLGGFRYPPIGKLIAAAAFAFSLIFAGVLIVLELNKGTLTIESDVDDVPIRIMQAEKVVQQLKVSKQGQTVRIAAGNYIVELDGEFTDLSVVQGVVSIRRGDTGTVRIAMKDANDTDAGKVPSTVLAAIKTAIERDSAIPDREWQSLDARRQAVDHRKVRGTPLTFMFLSIQTPETLSKSMIDELSVLDSATAAGMFDEIERKESPYTFMHADRIREVVCEMDKDMATGTFSFLVPGLCKGKIGYRARRTDSGWSITDFLLPAYGIQLVRDGELWESKTLVASEQAVTDSEKLQGEWRVTGLRSGGQDADVTTCDTCKYIFTGDTLTITGDQASVAEMTLRTDATPKEIDLKAIEGAGAGKTIHGIYRFDGDRLVLCLGDERPKQFSGDGEAGLLVLDRRQITGSSNGVGTEETSGTLKRTEVSAGPE